MPVVVAFPLKVDDAWEIKPPPSTSAVPVAFPSAVGVNGKVLNHFVATYPFAEEVENPRPKLDQ